jgi:hypothetical protein
MSKRKTRQNIRDDAWRKSMDEIREKYGRIGMLDSDHYGTEFRPNPMNKWTKRELRNRIAWLQKQRGQLIAKRESLVENSRKLSKYTRELFKRESAKNQASEREEYNAKRRRRRATAKRKIRKALEDKWIEERNAARKCLR